MRDFTVQRNSWMHPRPNLWTFAALTAGVLLLLLAVTLQAQESLSVPSTPGVLTPTAPPPPQGRIAALKAKIAPPATNVGGGGGGGGLGRA